MAKHKVHFFKIGLVGDDTGVSGDLFSDACTDIVGQEVSLKNLVLTDDAAYRLNYFVKNGDYFEGKIVKFRNSQAITGSISDDDLTDFTLESGKKFTEVTHFIYCPETGIMSFEYNHSGTFNTTFMRYVNGIQLNWRTDSKMFKALPLMHPDVIQRITEAKKIKALTVSLPVAKIPTDMDQNNMLRGLRFGSQLGNPGQISMTLTGATGKGDRSPLISVEDLVSSINNDDLDLSIFGKVSVDIATEFGAETINLLENKFESTKNWDVSITNENARRWFDDIRSFYQANRALLLISAGHMNAE